MSDFGFDEQLDRVLHRRAEAEVPASLLDNIAAMLLGGRARRVSYVWWKAALAACLPIGFFIYHYSHVPKPAHRQTIAHVAPAPVQKPGYIFSSDGLAEGQPHPQSKGTCPGRRRGKLHLDAGARLSREDTRNFTFPALQMTFDTPPTTLRVAQHTAACALIPCSCPEMCSESN